MLKKIYSFFWDGSKSNLNNLRKFGRRKILRIVWASGPFSWFKLKQDPSQILKQPSRSDTRSRNHVGLNPVHRSGGKIRRNWFYPGRRFGYRIVRKWVMEYENDSKFKSSSSNSTWVVTRLLLATDSGGRCFKFQGSRNISGWVWIIIVTSLLWIIQIQSNLEVKDQHFLKELALRVYRGFSYKEFIFHIEK